MPRLLVPALAFIASALLVASGAAPGQPPANKKQPAGKYDPPKPTRPDDATLKQIAAKTAELRKAVEGLKAGKLPDRLLVEVEIYLKAAENIVRFEEWYSKDSGKWALTTLDRGLERAKQATGWKGPAAGAELWQKTTETWVVRAYRSRVDDSIQPYAVRMPKDYWKDLKKQWPLHVILHGRDSSLTEAKFIATHSSGKAGPKELDHIELEVYGRGNNAYRWAGETDVFEAMSGVARVPDGTLFGANIVDLKRIVLRGFSMGGAGTWHLGLHHPDTFCVIGPGAGFTTTHGYISNLPKQLPDYQEKCLHIYDAVDYAENAFDVPVVAYSGEKDPQKAAADNIEKLLKGFKEPVRFTHLVAPGLAHQMPKEWQEKTDAEYRRYVGRGRDKNPDRIRFVTYTPKYSSCDWVRVVSLNRMYEKAVIDANRTDGNYSLKTENIRKIYLLNHAMYRQAKPISIAIDGQKVDLPLKPDTILAFEKTGEKWRKETDEMWIKGKLEKRPLMTGPIDDAFCTSFWVIPPVGPGWNRDADRHTTVALDEFARVWDRYFRGPLPMGPQEPKQEEAPGRRRPNLILFGDPSSNPKIAEVLPKLPITWTKEKLVVNGVEYNPKTHLPVLIYPILDHSEYPNALPRYVVLNSGHTFKEADLKGTNALLYPRLGDWAVIKPKPTAKDPAAYEVVAAGLFDENWQFPKK